MVLEPVDITERWGACKLAGHYVAFVATIWAATAKYATQQRNRPSVQAYRAADRDGGDGSA